MIQIAASQPAPPETIAGFVRAEGSAVAPWLGTLLSAANPRDATDAVHALCTLYGGHPDPIELASARADDAALRDWLAVATEAFTRERRWLASLVSAAGPLPSTPNHAQSEAALTQARHALDTLARSDRAGCAIGAAVALALDWQAVRPLLERLGHRVGLPAATSRLPPNEPALGGSITERARLFGAQQLLAQQRSLWILLEARSAARG